MSRAPGSPSLVLGFRVLLLLAAAFAGAAALVIGRSRDLRSSRAGATYVCPMHPEVTASGPGRCPICGMDFEPVGADAGPAAVANSTFQSYDYVRRRGLGQDLHAPADVDDDGVVEATLYDDELATLRTEEGPWVFSPSTEPGTRIDVRPTRDPPEGWDRGTSRVRLRVVPPACAPRPRDVGWLRLGARRLEVLVVPYGAVLESAEGPYVLVVAGDGRTLTRRPVEIGRVLGGLAVVVSGLRIQERVLARSAFFVDAERRLRRQAAIELSPW